MANQPGYAVPAEIGKRVLRPGGTELTHDLLEAVRITSADDVVEFAPGTGETAREIAALGPNSYTGIERDREAAATLRNEFSGPDREIVVGDAAGTDRRAASADVVVGEAMLTMQPEDGTAAIMAEANRLLRPGGRYGIHELGLVPDDLDADVKATIREDLTAATKVPARPRTGTEWASLLEEAGFSVTWRSTSPMRLLEPTRVLDDEGVVRTLAIAYNLLTHPEARRRLRSMRRVFNRHGNRLRAIAIVAEK